MAKTHKSLKSKEIPLKITTGRLFHLGSFLKHIFPNQGFTWGLLGIYRNSVLFVPSYLGGGFKSFCIFTLIWGRFRFWLIFFKWIEATNQLFYGNQSNLKMDPQSTIPWIGLEKLELGRVSKLDKNTCMCQCAVLCILYLVCQGLISMVIVSPSIRVVGPLRNFMTPNHLRPSWGPILLTYPQVRGHFSWDPWLGGMVDLKDSPLKKVHEVWRW